MYPAFISHSPSDEAALVEELLASHDVVLHRVDPHLFVSHARAAGLGRELDRGVHAEAARARVGVAAEERPAQVLALEVVRALEELGLPDDRGLAGGLLPVAFDRDHV